MPSGTCQVVYNIGTRQVVYNIYIIHYLTSATRHETLKSWTTRSDMIKKKISVNFDYIPKITYCSQHFFCNYWHFLWQIFYVYIGDFLKEPVYYTVSMFNLFCLYVASI